MLWDSGSALLSETYIAYGGYNANGMVISNGNLAELDWDGGSCFQSLSDGILFYGEAITLRNLAVRDNGGDGLDISSRTVPELQTLTVTGNPEKAIYIRRNPGGFPAGLGGTGNGYNGIYIDGTLGGEETDGMWIWEKQDGFPYILGNVTVPAQDTLDVAAGTVIKGSGVTSSLQVNADGVW